MENVKMLMEDAFKNMKQAFALLSSPSVKSRENSLALTKLEEAMMWCNKDRTIKGFLTPYGDTHVEKMGGGFNVAPPGVMPTMTDTQNTGK